MEESLLEGLRFRKVPLVFVDVGPRVAHEVSARRYSTLQPCAMKKLPL
jgi:hypothetical protein